MESKVLIIDDDERLQRLLREYLEGYGFRVVSLYEGSGAVEMLEKTTPNIVILDIMLPHVEETLRHSSGVWICTSAGCGQSWNPSTIPR